MVPIRLAQPVALHLEFILSHGFSANQLKHMIDHNDFSKLHSLQHAFLKVENFIAYADQYGDTLKQAITEGYKIKFTTLKGLVNFIDIKYSLKAGEDFQVGDDYLNHVPLSQANAEVLQRVIASSWIVKRLENPSDQVTPLYRIEIKGK